MEHSGTKSFGSPYVANSDITMLRLKRLITTSSVGMLCHIADLNTQKNNYFQHKTQPHTQPKIAKIVKITQKYTLFKPDFLSFCGKKPGYFDEF